MPSFDFALLDGGFAPPVSRSRAIYGGLGGVLFRRTRFPPVAPLQSESATDVNGGIRFVPRAVGMSRHSASCMLILNDGISP